MERREEKLNKRKYYFTFLAVVLLASQISFSCTSFVLKANKTLLFGSNYDNDIWPGLLYVNKKNVKKMGRMGIKIRQCDLQCSRIPTRLGGYE
jgi:hypothetical protein